MGGSGGHMDSGLGSSDSLNGPSLTLSAPRIAKILCFISSFTVILALSLTHFNPRRFRIHAWPYLSDAGLHDPERIVLSFGLACTGALFLPIGGLQYLRMAARGPVPALKIRLSPLPFPVVLSAERSTRLILPSTLCFAFFISLFSAVPGLMLFHHLFALFFAASAVTWCFAVSTFAHAVAASDTESDARVWRRIRLNYALTMGQLVCWVLFGIVWILLKLGWPTPFVPNTDYRFYFLASFEYVSTASLIYFIHITARDMAPFVGRVSLSHALPSTMVTAPEVSDVHLIRDPTN